MSAPAVLPPESLSPQRRHPDDDAIARYSAVSRPAILALFLGLASALALVSPILVIVPLAAAAAAVVALRQIAASGGQYSGRWAATIGLCLAMLFAGWGLSREWTRDARLQRQARQYAESWLQVVREGQIQRADQFTHSPHSRLSSDAAIAEFYKSNKEAAESMKALFSSEPIKTVSSMRSHGSIEFRAVASQSRHGFSDDVTLQFAVRPSESAEEMPLWITVTRTVGSVSTHPAWQIGRATGDPPAELGLGGS
jgi:hypothetical protein